MYVLDSRLLVQGKYCLLSIIWFFPWLELAVILHYSYTLDPDRTGANEPPALGPSNEALQTT